MHIFGLWEETGEYENYMQKNLISPQGSNLEAACFQAVVSSAL